MTAQRGMISEHNSSLEGWKTAQMYLIRSQRKDWLSGVDRYYNKRCIIVNNIYIIYYPGHTVDNW